MVNQVSPAPPAVLLKSEGVPVCKKKKKTKPTTSVKCNKTSCISYHIWR